MDDRTDDRGAAQDEDRNDEDRNDEPVVVDTGSRIELHRGDDVVAFADYRLEGDVMVVPYVESHPRHRGQGWGAVVVEAVADHAIHHGRRIRPLCGFASAELRARSDAPDLLVPR